MSDVAQGSLDPVRVALQEWVEQGYIGEDGECQGAAAYAPRLYKQSIAALAAQPPAAPVETELWATLDERPATPVDMKSAPDQRAPQNTTERLPDREVAGSGADTQCSADMVDALAKTIWLAEFERAFSRAPSDPWENQAESAKAAHLNTARKIIEAGFVTGAVPQGARESAVIAAIDPFTRGAFTGWMHKSGADTITLDEAEDHFSLCMADMMDAAREAACSLPRPQCPSESAPGASTPVQRPRG